MKARDPIALIEAAYRVDLPSRAWLEQLAMAAEAFVGLRRGALACSYDASGGDWIRVVDTALRGLAPDFGRFFPAPRGSPSAARALAKSFAALDFATLRSSSLPRSLSRAYATLMDRSGIDDIVCWNGKDATRGGCLVAVVTHRKTYSPHTARLFRRLGAHIAAGARLRRSLEEIGAPAGEPSAFAEAVFGADGRLEHARDAAKEPAARAELSAVVARLRRARSRELGPERAAGLWDGLIAGRWSIALHFERDGKQYYVAHKNPLELVSDRALSAREQEVLARADVGQSNKEIAFALGLSVSSISTLLTRARRKLGVRARA
jgi:DNA-binding CsgD family transcriptional regulator